jgi:medium-chain acyl-[acyl-carrier-protein] hydrolase
MYPKKDSGWLVTWPRKSTPKIRLFCFPYAGGNGQIFKAWAESLPDFIEVVGVELPGRGRRFGEPFVDDINQVINDLYESIKSSLDIPFAFYGHSNGALLVFELTKKILERTGLLPRKVFIAAKRSPHLGREVPLHKLCDEDFIKVIRDYKGTPVQVFSNPELLELYLPILRADFALSENYVFLEQPQLSVDAVLIAGEEDEIASIDEVFAWEDLFVTPPDKEIVTGDHFFINSCQEHLFSLIQQKLNPELMC